MSNEITIKIGISDDLMGTIMTAYMASASPIPLPQMLGALLSEKSEKPNDAKPPMGFRSAEEK